MARSCRYTLFCSAQIASEPRHLKVICVCETQCAIRSFTHGHRPALAVLGERPIVIGFCCMSGSSVPLMLLSLHGSLIVVLDFAASRWRLSFGLCKGFCFTVNATGKPVASVLTGTGTGT